VDRTRQNDRSNLKGRNPYSRHSHISLDNIRSPPAYSQSCPTPDLASYSTRNSPGRNASGNKPFPESYSHRRSIFHILDDSP